VSGLSEDLELNIQPALSSVADLSDALTKAATDFSASLSENVQAALSGIDPSVLEASLTSAVQAVDTSLAVTPDTSALTGDITEAVAAADTTVSIEGDTSAIPSEIEGALAEASTTVVLEGDGSAVTTEGDTAVQAIDPTVVLQADTSQLVDQGNAAAQSVFEAQVSNVASGVGSSQGIIASGAEATVAAEGVNALTAANQGLSAANAGLEGSVGGVTSALGSLGAGIAGVTALAGGFFAASVNEETSLNRLKFVYGDNVQAVQQVTLANNNFNLSLQEIATSTGASLPGLEQANSRIGSIGSSAQASAPQIAQTANQITALATYLAVTNPALGSADTIMGSLTNALARGGRSASSLGLSLDASAISAKAHAIATADGRDTVTQFDKVAAGAAITTDHLGSSLGTAVSQGSNEAALALPKLTETLKETVAAVGAPLIGPITQLFTQIAPPLEQVVTAIGHLLVAAAPLGVVLGVVLKVLGDLASIITAIPVPILTTAIVALTGAMAVNAAVDFAAGLFTLGAAATADIGIVGLLTVAVDALEVALGPVGLTLIALSAAWAISSNNAKNNAANAVAYTQSLIGVKSGTDLATESTATLNTQLGTITSKISDLKSQLGGVGGFFAQAFGFDDAKIAQIKALTDEEGKLKAALAATNSAAGDTSGTQAATAAQQAFATALQASAAKLDGVKVAITAVESANNSLVTAATGKLVGVSTVFGDVSTAIDAAAKASASQATSSNSGAAALATQATHAKDLRDAITALNTAQTDFNTLAAGPSADKVSAGLLTIESSAKSVRDALQKVADTQTALDTLAAGPTAEELAAGYLTIEQAAKSTSAAQQAVVDAQTALNLLAAGPTGDTKAQAAEAVAKAQTNQEKATLALSDAQLAQANAIAAGTATARQLEDAQIKVTEAQYGLADASRALSVATVAQSKLTTDALPGSRAMTDAQTKLADAQLALKSAQQAQEAAQDTQNQTIANAVPGSAALTAAHNALSDAELALAQAQQSQEVAQDAQNKLFSDSLPNSAAYATALQKVSDAQDHLTSVVESGSAKQASATSAAAKTHVDALSALSQGLDDQIAAENKFYSDLQKIQAEGGTEIVAELLAQGPKTGAAEATAVAGATVTVVAALETKTETLKTAEDKHAQDIATIFGASLNANLTKAFSTQLANETAFYANVQKIFEAGDTVLANILLAQGPVQGGALANAVANATPIVQKALENQAEQLKAAEASAGTDVGKSFGDGLFAGINGANARVFAAAQALGTAAKDGTAAAIKPGSPSLVAMELGSQWAEGLALGVTGGIPLVVSAATQLASALVVSPNAPALATGTTVAATGGLSSVPGSVVNNVTVNEVAQNPQATAFAVSSRLAVQATR
jgi:hypothetical protein